MLKKLSWQSKINQTIILSVKHGFSVALAAVGLPSSQTTGVLSMEPYGETNQVKLSEDMSGPAGEIGPHRSELVKPDDRYVELSPMSLRTSELQGKKPEVLESI